MEEGKKSGEGWVFERFERNKERGWVRLGWVGGVIEIGWLWGG